MSRGVQGLLAGPLVDGRIRVAGAGRPPITRSAPGVVQALEHLVEPVTRGDPESPLRGVSVRVWNQIEQRPGTYVWRDD